MIDACFPLLVYDGKYAKLLDKLAFQLGFNVSNNESSKRHINAATFCSEFEHVNVWASYTFWSSHAFMFDSLNDGVMMVLKLVVFRCKLFLQSARHC